MDGWVGEWAGVEASRVTLYYRIRLESKKLQYSEEKKRARSMCSTKHI